MREEGKPYTFNLDENLNNLLQEFEDKKPPGNHFVIDSKTSLTNFYLKLLEHLGLPCTRDVIEKKVKHFPFSGD